MSLRPSAAVSDSILWRSHSGELVCLLGREARRFLGAFLRKNLRPLRRRLCLRSGESRLLQVQLRREGLVDMLRAANVEERASRVILPVAQVRDVHS